MTPWPQSPLSAAEPKVLAFDRTVRGKIVARCRCGRKYTAAQWARLRLVGHMDDGEGGRLEMRECRCGSTRSVSAPLARPQGADARRRRRWRVCVALLAVGVIAAVVLW
jgi:hypothetical protein